MIYQKQHNNIHAVFPHILSLILFLGLCNCIQEPSYDETPLSLCSHLTFHFQHFFIDFFSGYPSVRVCMVQESANNY